MSISLTCPEDYGAERWLSFVGSRVKGYLVVLQLYEDRKNNTCGFELLEQAKEKYITRLREHAACADEHGISSHTTYIVGELCGALSQIKLGETTIEFVQALLQTFLQTIMAFLRALTTQNSPIKSDVRYAA